MSRLVNLIKDFFIPISCISCSKFLEDRDQFLCGFCSSLIKSISTLTLKLTEKVEAKVFAVSDYKDPMRAIVLAKHSRNRVAAQHLGVLLWESTDLKYTNFDYIVPLPLHWTRYAWRWYNQAEVMAEEIARLSNKPVLHLLKRSRRTISQTGLSRKERKTNMEDAFSLTEDSLYVQDKTVLFIDDVMTTGTTIRSALKATRSLKIKNFLIGVACRVG